MKTKLSILAAVLAIAMYACTFAGEPAAPASPKTGAVIDNGMAPKLIAGSQLQYADNHGKNIYTFFKDGRYRYATMSQNQTTAGSREGKYLYTITAPGKATITLDKTEAIRLSFDTPLTATGTLDGDVRKYRFQIIRPDGE